MTIKEEFDQMFKDLQEKAKARLHDGFALIFAKYPELQSFGWGQWTTYFNDGDECHFYLREYYGTVNGYTINPDYTDGKEAKEYKAANPWVKDAVKDVWEALDAIPEDIMKMIYGDHVIVTVTRNGETKIVEHGDHD
jgi:hypothetical protein